MKIQFELNGNPVDVDVQAEQNFMTLLRETFGLIGTKEGCSIGECGTCSVLVNGELRKSCLMLAVYWRFCIKFMTRDQPEGYDIRW